MSQSFTFEVLSIIILAKLIDSLLPDKHQLSGQPQRVLQSLDLVTILINRAAGLPVFLQRRIQAILNM